MATSMKSPKVREKSTNAAAIVAGGHYQPWKIYLADKVAVLLIRLFEASAKLGRKERPRQQSSERPSGREGTSLREVVWQDGRK